MRIIAGALRGRKFLPPASDVTRPITDRVKQSIFDVLSQRIDSAVVYDCFAGTGSMGLECLSRGATHATFFEADRSAVILLKQNVQTLALTKQSTIVPADLFKWFAGAPAPAAKADLIFLDPPYRMLRENTGDLLALALLFANHITPEGVVIFRHNQADELRLPPFNTIDRRDYNGMTIELLARS